MYLYCFHTSDGYRQTSVYIYENKWTEWWQRKWTAVLIIGCNHGKAVANLKDSFFLNWGLRQIFLHDSFPYWHCGNCYCKQMEDLQFYPWEALFILVDFISLPIQWLLEKRCGIMMAWQEDGIASERDIFMSSQRIQGNLAEKIIYMEKLLIDKQSQQFIQNNNINNKYKLVRLTFY